MEKSTVLMSLTLFTLLCGLAFGFYESWAVDKSKKQGEHADGSKDRPEA